MATSPNDADKARRISILLLMSATLCWPAIWNGYPLLFDGDSIDYLAAGESAARAIFLQTFSEYYGVRSLIYSLGIYAFHWNISAWPVVGLHAVLTAFVLRLIVQGLFPGNMVRAYVLTVLSLCLLTGLGWYVSMVMPDILAPLLYLSLYLIAFEWERLSGMERTIMMAVSVWATGSHGSHLIIATGLSVFLVILLVLQNSRRCAARPAARLAGLLILSVVLPVSFHSVLYGKPKLFNNNIPILLARVATSEAGQRYLHERCLKPDLVICGDVINLPDVPENFIWTAESIWQNSSPAKRALLLEQEASVVLGVVSSYPWEFFRSAVEHTTKQLGVFGLQTVVRSGTWVEENIGSTLAGGKADYFQSRQARGNLHERLFESIQRWVVLASLAVLIAIGFSPRFWRNQRSVALTVVIIFSVLLNAAVTGTLSDINDRYQGRVIWLLPFLATMLILLRIPGFDDSATDTNHPVPGAY